MKINKKQEQYVWTCDYCGQEFESKDISDKHEVGCGKNPKNERFFSRKNIILNILFSLMPIFLVTFLIQELSDLKSASGIVVGVFIILTGLLRKKIGNKITFISLTVITFAIYFAIISLL